MRVLIDGVGIYKCEWCKASLTAEHKPHLTIVIGERSGLVNDYSVLPGWRFVRLFRPNRYHFCAPSCLASWAEAVMLKEPAPAEYVA